MPTSKDYIYLAGIIDGEGCIRVNSAPRLHVTNTNIILVNWLHETFGGYVWHENKSYKPNSKPRHLWEISGLNLYSTLKQVNPYLKLKKRQCDCVLEYSKHRKRGTGYLSKISSKSLNTLKAELKILNKKGLV